MSSAWQRKHCLRSLLCCSLVVNALESPHPAPLTPMWKQVVAAIENFEVEGIPNHIERLLDMQNDKFCTLVMQCEPFDIFKGLRWASAFSRMPSCHQMSLRFCRWLRGYNSCSPSSDCLRWTKVAPLAGVIAPAASAAAPAPPVDMTSFCITSSVLRIFHIAGMALSSS